jgi:dTDP-4-dehydrorhamnose 3,5-epimerase
MKVTPLAIDGAWLIEAPTYPDNRGLFREWFKVSEIEKSKIPFFDIKQANTSISGKGVIRGIHYSSELSGQSKLVSCTAGSALDVVVDLRIGSKTFGHHEKVNLTDSNGLTIFISSGLGHGFQSLEDNTAVTYLLSREYSPDDEFGVNPLDDELSIQWPIAEKILSERDMSAKGLNQISKVEP